MDNHLAAEYTSLYYMPFKEFRETTYFSLRWEADSDEYTDCPINLSSKVQHVFMELDWACQYEERLKPEILERELKNLKSGKFQKALWKH